MENRDAMQVRCMGGTCVFGTQSRTRFRTQVVFLAMGSVVCVFACGKGRRTCVMKLCPQMSSLAMEEGKAVSGRMSARFGSGEARSQLSS